jgi:hypothetical protein
MYLMFDISLSTTSQEIEFKLISHIIIFIMELIKALIKYKVKASSIKHNFAFVKILNMIKRLDTSLKLKKFSHSLKIDLIIHSSLHMNTMF